MKATRPSSTIRTERWNSSSLPGSSLVWRLVRWGRMLVETAWKSCSGARAIISTLKMKPAAAAPCRPRMTSGPALRKACSLNMITSTAAAKPPPLAIETEDVLVACRCGGAGGARRAWRGGRRRRERPSGESAGAATIPIATADWPLRMLTATSTAKIVRKHDSERISATKRPKRLLPARKPRAK